MRGPSLYTDPNGFRKGHNVDKDEVKIPSGNITMTEEDGSDLEAGPLYGTGTTTGETKYMEPGKDYEFTGDNEVVESKPPLKQKKSKAKYRKDGTLKKVVTKDKETGYKSKIKFDKTGRIKSAKNNRTKNKHKKSKQRLSRSKWVREDMAETTEKHFPTVKKKKKVVKTAEK
tara:strand:+ start:125 stop:640 length:516 start_codon:yes stop_codon:yes gene_type:complete